MADAPVASSFQTIPLTQIKASTHQARKVFDEEALKGLAESMRQEGLMQPVTVRRSGEMYELISGERRVRAALLLGWTAIDAKILATASEGEAAAKGLIENLQRQDLSPMEEAEGFQELLNLHDDYWNQRNIAQTVGKTEGYISQSLAFLKLPDKVREDFSRLKFSRSHALELLRLSDPEQQTAVAEKIFQNDLSRSATRSFVNELLKGSHPAKDAEANPADRDPLIEFWKGMPDGGHKSGFSVRYKKGEWTLQLKAKSDHPVTNLSALLSQLGRDISDFASKKGSADI